MGEAGRVLIVDDDPGIRAMLVEYLGSHGYTVVEAQDGAAMRDQLELARPDVVLLDLLRVFAENPGRALSRDRLLTLTRNREWDPYDRSIDIRVARLRKKVELDPERPQLIRTIRGVGYMFTPSGRE